jgi:YcxB-like protein
MVNAINPIDLRVRLTVSDLYQLRAPLKSAVLRVIVWCFGLCFALLMTVLAIMAASRSPQYWPVLAKLLPPFALAMAILFLAFALPFLSAREAIKNPNLSGELLYSFTPDGVQAVGPTAKTSLNWRAFLNVHEAKDAFWLYLSTENAFILPKRCFSSENDIAAFRSLVFECIPKV